MTYVKKLSLWVKQYGWGRRNWFGSTKFADEFKWKHADPAVTNVYNKRSARSPCSKELSWQGWAVIKAGREGFCEWELHHCPYPLWREPPGGRSESQRGRGLQEWSTDGITLTMTRRELHQWRFWIPLLCFEQLDVQVGGKPLGNGHLINVDLSHLGGLKTVP